MITSLFDYVPVIYVFSYVAIVLALVVAFGYFINAN